MVWILTLSAHQGLLVSAINTTADNRVAILALAPYGVGEWHENPTGPAFISAVRLAVDRINNRTDILPGYHIQLLEAHSGCQVSTKTAYEFLSNVVLDGGTRLSPIIVGVIGPACSTSAHIIGSLGARDGISLIQISPIATSPLLTDTVRYRNMFRTVSTALQQIRAVAQLMTLNSWENVAILYEHSHKYFRTTFEMLITIQSNRIGLTSQIYSGYYQLESISAQFKVIARSQLAREVICLAHHHQPKITYPVYQWIIVDQLNFTLTQKVTFVYNGRHYSCTQELMMEALEGTIMTSYHFLTQELNDQQTDVDLTTEQYHELYLKYLKKHLMELKLNEKDASCRIDLEKYTMPFYDATWALALALNASIERILPATLADYGLGQPQTTEIVRQELLQLQFTGLIGIISFQTMAQDSVTPIAIHQSIRGESTLIGVYNGSVLQIVSTKAKFVSEEFLHAVIGVHPAITGLSFVLVAIFTLYTISLHAIFIIFHNHKSIKAASFETSHFMFSGCYLFLLQAFIMTLGGLSTWHKKSVQEIFIAGIFCNINEWLNIIGISLISATLCGTLWRVYRIFHYFNTKRFLISDYTLTAFIVVVVGVNVAFLTVWTIIDPLLAKFEQQGIEYNDEDEPVLLVRGSCHCRLFTLWTLATHSVIILILTCVVILASLNRRISRRYFQTAKLVNLMVYVISPAFFLGNILAFFFQSLDIHYTYLSWQISLLSIVCLVCMCIFTPPAYGAIRHLHIFSFSK